MTAPHAPLVTVSSGKRPVTVFGPDFPFPFDDWITHKGGLASLPAARHGNEVAIIGAGMAGMVAAFELMKLGLKPVIYEAGRIGGRLRSQAFEGAQGIIAELGGMRFPVSGTAFYHYVDMLGLESKPFPNPLSDAAGSTVVDLESETSMPRSRRICRRSSRRSRRPGTRRSKVRRTSPKSRVRSAPAM